MNETKITSTQKELLKQLANNLLKLAGETEKDDTFNSFLANLKIFNTDLLESFNIIYNNIEEE